jgi:hypothetical protein
MGRIALAMRAWRREVSQQLKPAFREGLAVDFWVATSPCVELAEILKLSLWAEATQLPELRRHEYK